MRLFLCEKPSQGKDIAKVLGANTKKDGFYEGAGIVVTWARGHLLENASPDAYGEQFGVPWRKDVLPIIPTQWKMVVKKDVVAMFKTISQLLKQASSVVIATDADREGEVIAREILDMCKYKGSIQRLWLSALDEASIRRAIETILPGEKTESLYLAGLGRSRADWLIGMNMTRFFSIKAREQGYSGLLSVGRVQTPTLALVVQRDREISQFVPKSYWQVKALLQHQEIRFTAAWIPAKQYCDDEKRCIQLPAAKAAIQLCQQAGRAKVCEVLQKREKHSAPLVFDLGTLQQVASKKWGLGAKQVLEIAQSLYEKHKAATYPRTDCGYLPISMRAEIPQVLQAIEKSDPSLSSLLPKLDTKLESRVWNDKKITAHHGIIPTKQPPVLSAMSKEERQVYELIRTYYLAQFLPVQEIDITTISFDIGGQLFVSRGYVEVVQGWKLLFSNSTEEEDTEEDSVKLPTLSQGDQCVVTNGELKQLETKPPQHYTDGTLIAAMKNAAVFVTDPALKKVLKDNAGLGTEATRAGIITTLEERKFLCRQKKFLLATDIGCQLVDALPAVVTNPGMTALWEQALESVADGKLPLATFIDKQKAWIHHLLEKTYDVPLKLDLPPMPACPKCQGKMVLREGKKGRFWSCQRFPDCDGIISLSTSNKTKNSSFQSGKKKKSKNVKALFS
ncbi:DNA topoisomerase III [Xenorhabdus bovienii]|uniref:DNA topoisomerase III n=1 Tax=Xenorhabdus bovienii TaxID=40576 RepID=UPI00237CC7E5|nr:DNA topoisomerase III [Xenorhabdus bovienii]MDE1485129.1 DNA topoisomerase III [Xenorhabdus bovienii]MDE9475992.1 DNA topoisomerase III [Xenorhabdus bovienii]MDE9528761.1 DNA topoisomerase III [Xenorhabdus bovienii]